MLLSGRLGLRVDEPPPAWAGMGGVVLAFLVLQKIESDAGLDEVTRLVARAHDAVADDFDLPHREAEAIVRVPLWGDTHLLMHIAPQVLGSVQLQVLLAFVRIFQFEAGEIKALVIAAEQAMRDQDLLPDAEETAVVGATTLEAATVALAVPVGTPSTTRRCSHKSDPADWAPLSISPGEDDGSRGPIPGGPQTLFGLFIRAAATNRPTLRDHWLAELDRTGNVNFHYGAVAVYLAAVYRRFRGRNVREVACFVKHLTEFYSVGTERIWPLETELLIRNALGEKVPLEGISVPESEIKMFVAVNIAYDLRVTLKEFDQLLVEAEQLAATRGYHLTPA
jgi:hypothetical protein